MAYFLSSILISGYSGHELSAGKCCALGRHRHKKLAPKSFRSRRALAECRFTLPILFWRLRLGARSAPTRGFNLSPPGLLDDLPESSDLTQSGPDRFRDRIQNLLFLINERTGCSFSHSVVPPSR